MDNLKRRMPVRIEAVIFALAVFAMAFSMPAAATDDCITMLPNLLFNTISNCASQPEIDRILGTQKIRWAGHDYIVGNTGNDLQIWKIDNAASPEILGHSNFRVGNVGDSDYDLLNYSLCDDCRYGVANFKRGTVLFDLGTSAQPLFSTAFEIHSDSNVVPGAFTFTHDGNQYLIAEPIAGVDSCPTGDSTLYRFNGVSASDLSYVGCVDPGETATSQIVGGYYVDGILYLGDKTTRVYQFEARSLLSTISLNFMGQPFVAYMIKDKGLALDRMAGIAVEANTKGMTVWDISDPSAPAELGNVPGDFNRAAVAYPIAWVAKKGYPGTERTYNISNPGSPLPLDQQFWDVSHDYNYPDSKCAEIQGATFSSDGTVLYLSRYSILQMADFTLCAGPISPVAKVDVAPSPVFPGEQVTIANDSLGAVDRLAIWVTASEDPDANPVEGFTTLSPVETTDNTITFDIPIDLLASEDYWAHVAVESEDFLYVSPTATPEQVATVAVEVEREPQVAIAISPPAPITGDSVALSAIVDGVPSNPDGGSAYEWLVTSPTGAATTGTASSLNVDLVESGDWDFHLAVRYEHESILGGGVTYDAVADELLSVTSVSADFTYSPSNPINTVDLTLDASSSNIVAGGTPSYQWAITGPTPFSCPAAVTCTIPAETLLDGNYDFQLTVTNDDDGEFSVKTIEDVFVADGHIQLDFSISPLDPEIGDTITFRIEGVGADLDAAVWNFGGTPCPGSSYLQTTTCTPGLYTDCKTQGYTYSSSGTKTVTLGITVEGRSYGPVSRQVTVANTGSCDSGTTTCSYTISPTSSSIPGTGGTSGFAVSTTSDCSWSATKSNSWIQITSGTAGTGSGYVAFNVDANTGAARSGWVRVAGKTHTISQATGVCTYSLSSLESTFDAAGGTGTVTVNSNSGCAWSAASTEGWVAITSGASGSGTGNVNFRVDFNPWASARDASLNIAGNTFTVNQTGLIPTDFTISDPQPDIGDTVTFRVPSGLTPVRWHFGDENCAGRSPMIDCTYLSDAACRQIEWTWSDAGVVYVSLETTTGDKSKAVWVQGEGECPIPCVADMRPNTSFTMSPVPAMVGTEVVFTDTSGTTKSSNLALGFTNDPVSPEIGELVQFDITGVGSVDSAQWNFGEAGCSGYPEIKTCVPGYTDCLKYGHKFASAGVKTVSLSVISNGVSFGPYSKSVTVQDVGSCDGGGGGCTYSINPTTATFPAAGGSGALTVSTQTGCAWNASSTVNWATITSGATGSGSGTVSYTVSANTSVARNGIIKAAGKNHYITQLDDGGGGGCTYSINPTTATFPAAGGPGALAISTQPGCDWTASSTVNWATITAGASGSGPGTVYYTVGANTGVLRNGTILAAGKTHGITQAEGGGGGGGTNADPTEWYWVIKLDGLTVATSEEPSFSHVFTDSGLYDVELTASNCRGADTEVQTLQVDPAPIPQPEDFIVPAAVHAPGLNGTLWKTDLRLFNPGSETVEVEIEYLPEGVNNSGGIIYGLDFMLGAKATRVFPDVVDAIPGVGGDANKGSLRIAFQDSLGGQPTVRPQIMSRTYNDTATGTFGQFVPAVPVLPTEEGELFLTGLVENLYYRTNIGLANMGPDDVWVLLTVLDKNGVELGQAGKWVHGYSTEQVVKIAEAVGVQTAVNIFSVKVATYGADISTYASVVDNVTGDPVLYTFYPLDDEQVFIPGIAHLPGINDSVWRSDMSFFNATGESLEAQVEYIPAEDISDRPYAVFTGMKAGTAYHFTDVLGSLMNQDTKGYLIVTGLNGSVVPQIAARTYSQDAVAGTFGQNLKVFGSKDLLYEGESGFIAGVSNSTDSAAGFRTNLGVLNTNQEDWSQVAITVFDTAGEVVGERSMYLEPGEFKQFNLFQNVDLDNVDMEASVKIEVLLEGPVAAYASQVDNQTQDPILTPAQMVVIDQ